MKWREKVLTTQSDFIREISNVSSPEEAQEFLLAYREINPHADAKIGWMIGEVNRDVGRRIIEWFGCSHPVFGTTFPTPEEAFRKGFEMGEAMRGKDFDFQKFKFNE